MSRIIIKQITDNGTKLGIIKISNGRQAEQQAEKQLLHIMLGKDVELTHGPDGEPIIPGNNISISHTKGHLAIILSPTHHVGIDIEYRSERICRIAHRFLRIDEPFKTINDLLAAWCAKEALFKLHHKAKLTYQEMKIVPSERIAIDTRHKTVTPYTIKTTREYTLLYMLE